MHVSYTDSNFNLGVSSVFSLNTQLLAYPGRSVYDPIMVKSLKIKINLAVRTQCWLHEFVVLGKCVRSLPRIPLYGYMQI